MISLSLSKFGNDQGLGDPSGPSQASKIIYLPRHSAVRFDYPANLPADALGAAELIALIVIPGFAQQGISIRGVRIITYETNIRISLYQEKNRLVKEYEYPVLYLVQIFTEARQRLWIVERRTDLINKLLEELEKTDQDPEEKLS
jgi:hypothetical protein